MVVLCIESVTFGYLTGHIPRDLCLLLSFESLFVKMHLGFPAYFLGLMLSFVLHLPTPTIKQNNFWFLEIFFGSS